MQTSEIVWKITILKHISCHRNKNGALSICASHTVSYTKDVVGLSGDEPGLWASLFVF
jgi:hypothetical protein